VPNKEDHFPFNSEASLDNDKDGHPDEWNQNWDENLTTELTLDFAPFDPSCYKENFVSAGACDYQAIAEEYIDSDPQLAIQTNHGILFRSWSNNEEYANTLHYWSIDSESFLAPITFDYSYKLESLNYDQETNSLIVSFDNLHVGIYSLDEFQWSLAPIDLGFRLRLFIMINKIPKIQLVNDTLLVSFLTEFDSSPELNLYSYDLHTGETKQLIYQNFINGGRHWSDITDYSYAEFTYIATKEKLIFTSDAMHSMSADTDSFIVDLNQITFELGDKHYTSDLSENCGFSVLINPEYNYISCDYGNELISLTDLSTSKFVISEYEQLFDDGNFWDEYYALIEENNQLTIYDASDVYSASELTQIEVIDENITSDLIFRFNNKFVFYDIEEHNFFVYSLTN